MSDLFACHGFLHFAALGTNHAKPFGPELQVKQMLCGRLTKPQNLQEEIFPSLLLLFVKHQPFRKKVDSNATNLIHIHRNDEKHA